VRVRLAGSRPKRNASLCPTGLDNEQQDIVRKRVFEQHRCQRRTAPEDQAWPVHRLDAANALDNVRSKALERTPFKAVRPVGRDIFRTSGARCTCEVDGASRRFGAVNLQITYNTFTRRARAWATLTSG
jgi:hypothetical protein